MMRVSLLLLLFALFDGISSTSIAIYNATPTPVQLVWDPLRNSTTFNVHLYILVDAGNATTVAQGGAFWRWHESDPWQPAPVPLYDEHQVDPVLAGTTTRGYNIAWGQVLGPGETPPSSMHFRVWALGPSDDSPAEALASKPVVNVSLPAVAAPSPPIELSLFKAVVFTAGEDDGIHAHLVINAWPPQPSSPPDYQLFAEVAVATAAGAETWVAAGAPSRFEHTYDFDGASPSRRVSRYNLSWRLAPDTAAAAPAPCGRGWAGAAAISFRVRAFGYSAGGGGEALLIPSVRVACVEPVRAVHV
eukprot:Hpha_TRINITY_DN4136_c0_g1::TRINITY_DN4136_c0_g1_i1::g.194867::m.194867